MPAQEIATARSELARAEKALGGEQQEVLNRLVSRLETGAGRAGDGAKVRMLAAVVSQLAGTSGLAARH